jgi:methylase of polypeptide subunit release factors
VPAQRTDERPLGVVYTPASVASAMVRIALEPLVRGRSAGELAALRICDFAVGEGAFVRCVIDQLAAAIRGAWTHENTRDDEALSRTLAAACVTGVDVDARAIAIAREATACENLRVGDALSLDWNDPGFDVVVGNPPYVRQEWLADKRALDRYEVADGVADLYVYFLELAHRILRPGGRYCVITPNKWLTAEYARPLRAASRASSISRGCRCSQMPMRSRASCGEAPAFGVSRAGIARSAETSRPHSAIRACH